MANGVGHAESQLRLLSSFSSVSLVASLSALIMPIQVEKEGRYPHPFNETKYSEYEGKSDNKDDPSTVGRAVPTSIKQLLTLTS